MLTGLATSNPHDGDIDVDEGFMVKGVQRQGEVGFLTFFEHFDQMKVGDFLKKPQLPIWIICSESHYSILFSTNIKMAQ